MKHVCAILILAMFCFSIGITEAASQQSAPASGLVSKSTKAVGYQVGGGSTKIDLKGTSLMPLAGGIAKALLNTAGGLAVAIPASILYVFFVSRVDRLVIE